MNGIPDSVRYNVPLTVDPVRPDIPGYDGGDVIVVSRASAPVLTLTRTEALRLAARLIAVADPDAATHVRVGPLGDGADLVELLRAAARER